MPTPLTWRGRKFLLRELLEPEEVKYVLERLNLWERLSLEVFSDHVKLKDAVAEVSIEVFLARDKEKSKYWFDYESGWHRGFFMPTLN